MRENQANRCYSHRGTVPEGTAGKKSLRKRVVVFPRFHRFDYPSCALPVAAFRVIVFRKRTTQPRFVDVTALRQSLRDSNHHFRVVGVVKRFSGGIRHEFVWAAKLEEDVSMG
jgi:hypothetical protein